MGPWALAPAATAGGEGHIYLAAVGAAVACCEIDAHAKSVYFCIRRAGWLRLDSFLLVPGKSNLKAMSCALDSFMVS
jgi:hypothetical protein